MVSAEQFRSDASSSLSRRAVLAGVGVGAVASLAGCTGLAATGDGTDTPADTASPTPTPTSGGDGGSGADAVHPRWGFIGETMDTPVPVEADHSVELQIAAREKGPVPMFYFDPAGLFVEAGDVVEFVFATPDHAVTAFHPGLGRTQRVPDGAPALSSPMMTAGSYWLFRFETPGVYDLYCPPHEQFGMAMRVVVGEASGPGTEPVSTERPAHGQPRPPMATAATVLNDDALAPANIVEKGSVAWADVAAESKALQG